MKITPKIWNIIIAVVFVALIIYGYQKTRKLNALQNSIELFEENFEQQREQNQISFDSIQENVNEVSENIGQLKIDLSKLDQKRSTINAQSNENKSRIDRITDADSLTDILTRRYQR